jgi:molybdopterin-containing oxidoreductase family iron-sulfur binding subunit
MPSLKTKATGKAYWRSLDELADNDEFQRFVRNEFPAMADEMAAPGSRRNFLKFMGASMALAGMTACRWPTEQILPFTERPDGYTPGVPLHFATAMELAGVGTGLVVSSYDGRPIKIEGNPQHPDSRGATSSQVQAALLEMYDPERSSEVVRRADGERARSDWAAFEAFAGPHFERLAASGGRGLRVLSEASGSPSVAAMRRRFEQRFPQATWVEYEAFSRDNEREGTRLAFGTPLRTRLALDRAEVVLSLDEDFLLRHPAAVRYARDFTSNRRGDSESMNRLTVFESGYSLTGAIADRRVTLPSRFMPALVIALAAELFLERGLPLPAGADGLRRLLDASRGNAQREAVDWTIADELLEHRGASLVLAGPGLPPGIHALVHVINAALGNIGRTVHYTADADAQRPAHVAGVAALAAEIDSGEVDTLVVIGGNPVFDGPADLDLGRRIEQVPNAIRLGVYEDETAEVCGWHLPRAHFLESWGDTRGLDGTVSVAQPLIEPLWGGRSTIELLALLVADPLRKGHDIVRRTHGADADDAAWRRTLHDGVIAGTAWPTVTPTVGASGWAGDLSSYLSLPDELPDGQIELTLVPDASLQDGRFANNGWLQELPDPLTKLTWDNALLIGPATAEAFGLDHEDLARVTAGDASVELPVYVMPGQAAGTAQVSAGYGRRAGGRVAEGVGVDVYPLGSSDEPHHRIVKLERAGGTYKLATTQNHWAIDTLGANESEKRSRIHAREIDVATFREHPEAVRHMGPHYAEVDLWNQHTYAEGHSWGMAIDLSVCTGCNACVTACQAENNIPVVGKDEVLRGREMHWIRVDRYFAGEPEAPSVALQPVTCHHCENAPCEQVCPVAATVHDSEGLNVMVYNRCVGTRYCLNNCPYKVRRFNWFNNHKHETEVERMKHNPEVTVRSRGVMEKCTFCLQRINNAKIRAKNDGRELQDGDVTPACAQACPTQAITFGDLNLEQSRVRAAHEDPRTYALLEEMNIRPRLLYQARLRNRGADASHAGPGSGGHGAADEHGADGAGHGEA